MRKGQTVAVLKVSGKMPFDNARLIIVVIGCSKEFRQDFRRKIGIISREQDALDDIKIAFCTSPGLAGRKLGRVGGVGNVK